MMPVHYVSQLPAENWMLKECMKDNLLEMISE